MLDQLTANINTEGQDNPDSPLGTLQSGAQLLAKALSGYPELAEAAQMLADLGGGEGGGNAGGKAYNGTVDFMGTPIEIKDGIGDIEGNKVYVSPGGEVVADSTGKIMGRVENGKFAVIDKNQASMMEQNKMAERGAT